MDEVGLRKTLQVIGTIVCLAFYHKSFKKHGTFPGNFGASLKLHACVTNLLIAEHWFPREDGNIPDLPHIIIYPVNLCDQWESEIKHFLSPSSFNILLYIGRYDTQPTWWTMPFTVSCQPLPQCIILATTTVSLHPLLTFISLHFHSGGAGQCENLRTWSQEPDGPSEQNSMLWEVVSVQLGQQYTMFAVDEAHLAHKHNVAHMGFCSLKDQAGALVAMTTTPVMTRPQVWHLCSCRHCLTNATRICTLWHNGWESRSSTTTMSTPTCVVASTRQIAKIQKLCGKQVPRPTLFMVSLLVCTTRPPPTWNPQSSSRNSWAQCENISLSTSFTAQSTWLITKIRSCLECACTWNMSWNSERMTGKWSNYALSPRTLSKKTWSPAQIPGRWAHIIPQYLVWPSKMATWWTPTHTQSCAPHHGWPSKMATYTLEQYNHYNQAMLTPF